MDPTERFSGRADVYARARPSYPKATVDILIEHHGLNRESVVADIGSGTGIFTKLLLPLVPVIGVEPNADMRAEAEKAFVGERFQSVNARAEATTLSDASVDLVVAAQAFHWFDVEKAAVEHRRILIPGGHSALIWNDRDLDASPFMRELEAILLEHCPGYPVLQGRANTPEKFDAYFGPGTWTRRTVPNEQKLDRELLVARVMSSSYAPPGHEPLIRALESSFDRHAEGGSVTLSYTVVVIGGPMSARV